MYAKQLWIVVASMLAVALTACSANQPTEAGFAKVLDRVLGAQEDLLYRIGGDPSEIEQLSNGGKILVFNHKRFLTTFDPRYPIEKTERTTVSTCTTRFEVNKRKLIVAYQFDGNACKTPEPEYARKREPGVVEFDFALTSSKGSFTVGDRVIWVVRPCLDRSCDTLGPGVHVYEGTVDSIGAVSAKTTFQTMGLYWITTYVDKDRSGTLSTGDLVYGADPGHPVGTYAMARMFKQKYSGMTTLEALGKEHGGVTRYLGPPQDF